LAPASKILREGAPHLPKDKQKELFAGLPSALSDFSTLWLL
jgi:hypothetical protein